MGFESRLAELGIELPPAPTAKGVYRSLSIVGNLAFTAGHLPTADDGTLITGRLGDDLDQPAGYDAARRAGLALLATLRAELGSLDRVRRLVKLFAAVRCTETFTQQPAVVNGCSELFAEVFGADAGVAARTAIGVNALPLGVAIEIEAIFEVA